jgi:alkane 1-monooxygenase
MRKYLYLVGFQIPIITTISVFYDNWLMYLPVLEVFLLLPIIDFIVPGSSSNYSDTQEKAESDSRYYDYLLYGITFLWGGSWLAFFWHIPTVENMGLLIAKSINVGVGCGVIGINVGHELGHRNKPFEQFLAKFLLSTSLYMHFIVEHNKGHHRWVATPKDPATARYGESLYRFLPRTIFGSWLSAWQIEKKMGSDWYQNTVFHYSLIQLAMLVAVFFFFGWKAFIGYVISATVGILLLEVVNYIEHYGLERRQVNGKYEKVQSWHSWNSDHWVGRVHLFELSRHSDHHYMANRKFQVLRSMSSPQLPTGYPGMIVLSLFPPVWFAVMNKRVQQVRKEFNQAPIV